MLHQLEHLQDASRTVWGSVSFRSASKPACMIWFFTLCAIAPQPGKDPEMLASSSSAARFCERNSHCRFRPDTLRPPGCNAPFSTNGHSDSAFNVPPWRPLYPFQEISDVPVYTGNHPDLPGVSSLYAHSRFTLAGIVSPVRPLQSVPFPCLSPFDSDQAQSFSPSPAAARAI